MLIGVLGDECVDTRKVLEKKRKISHCYLQTLEVKTHILLWTLTSSVMSTSILHTVLIYKPLALNLL